MSVIEMGHYIRDCGKRYFDLSVSVHIHLKITIKLTLNPNHRQFDPQFPQQHRELLQVLEALLGQLGDGGLLFGE